MSSVNGVNLLYISVLYVLIYLFLPDCTQLWGQRKVLVDLAKRVVLVVPGQVRQTCTTLAICFLH